MCLSNSKLCKILPDLKNKLSLNYQIKIFTIVVILNKNISRNFTDLVKFLDLINFSFLYYLHPYLKETLEMSLSLQPKIMISFYLEI